MIDGFSGERVKSMTISKMILSGGRKVFLINAVG